MYYYEFLQENEYVKEYIELIENARSRDLKDSYFEEHHIKPKSINGTDSPENLVKLTAKEYFVTH